MIPLIGSAFAFGLLVGFIRRGSIANMSSIVVVWAPVLIVSLLVGMIPLFVDLDSAPRHALRLSSLAGILAFFLANLEVTRGGIRIGFALAGLGWFLNSIAIALNGGMPLSMWAWRHSGTPGLPTPGHGDFFRGSIAGPGTILRPLGDVIPVRAIQQVISVGDIFILLGIAVVIASGMTRARPVPEVEPA